jgi:hypothetical protein
VDNQSEFKSTPVLSEYKSFRAIFIWVYGVGSTLVIARAAPSAASAASLQLNAIDRPLNENVVFADTQNKTLHDE